MIQLSEKAATRYLSIPAAVVKDSTFPFINGEELHIAIDGNRLIVSKGVV